MVRMPVENQTLSTRTHFSSTLFVVLFLEKKNKEVPGDKEMEMLARSDGGATPKSLDSMALFRSGTERKDDLDSNGKSDWSNKITWGAIYEGEWGDFITPKFVAAAIKLDKYTRNHFYLDWSE